MGKMDALKLAVFRKYAKGCSGGNWLKIIRIGLVRLRLGVSSIKCTIKTTTIIIIVV